MNTDTASQTENKAPSRLRRADDVMLFSFSRFN